MKKSNWIIEYEIPPLRAIYHAAADNCTEQEVRSMVEEQQPMWRIRKITESPASNDLSKKHAEWLRDHPQGNCER